jgi:hypothetical protein
MLVLLDTNIVIDFVLGRQPFFVEAAELMIANPNTFGHFVIYESDNKSFQNSKKQLIDEIAIKYKVASNRLRFFFVKEKNPFSFFTSYFEFWLVPKKKNR